MSTIESQPTPLEITVSTADGDADGFVSIWNIAASTCGNDMAATRQLAATLLCFLCKKKCDFLVTSSTNAEYLDNWFERDPKILYDWKPESEYVDIVSQHAEVPANAFLMFLKNRKFDAAGKYNPTRAERVAWFQDMWCVG